jgi:PTH1 family peptidyl-tRNA hydrolase
VPATLKLIVGLGNPGREYAGTRHNVGFAVLDELAERFGCSFRNKLRFTAKVAEWNGPAGKIVLAKPQTYMNRSGAAVAALVNWLKLTPSDVLVVVDDADLPLGQIRLRSSGGSGGHNGLRSIIEALGGNEEFARLRIGIGRPDKGVRVNSDEDVGVNSTGSVAGLPAVAGDITDHVLGRFRAGEKKLIGPALARASDAVVACVEYGVPAAMNEFNRKEAPPCKSGTIGDEH